MGNIHFQRGDYGKAEACYEKAIKKTGDPRAYNNLAWLYYSINGDPKRAESLARKAVELSRDSSDFKDTLDGVVEKAGETPGHSRNGIPKQ
jgi:Flp pilus assembly protein TadD